MTTVAYKIGKGKNAKLLLIETKGRGNVPRNASKAVVQKAALELDGHLDSVAAVADALRKRLSELNNPGKISLEFGVELGLDISIPLITTGTSNAHFTVSLEWNNSAKND